LITELDISEIDLQERFRADYGDISLLANSIETIGLLHPVVVNSDKQLICGGRRIKAFQHLGRETIPARTVDIDSILVGEYAENEVRKDFTQSERVAIAKAIETEVGERRGGDRGNQHTGGKRQNFDVCQNKRTDEIAAQKAGFGNKETYRQAKKVIEEGTPELITALDENRIKPSVASQLTELPPAEQILLASKGKEKEAQQVAKELKKAKQQDKNSKLNQKKKEILQATRKDISENRPSVFHLSCNDFIDMQDDESVDLLITDPPYSTDVQDINKFVEDWLPNALAKVKPTGRAYICIGAYPEEISAYLRLLQKQNKFILDNPLIWTYRNVLGVTPKNKYNLNYQIILHLYTKDSPPLDTSITNEMFSVQDINAPDGRQGDRYHAWQKPEELGIRLIRHSTRDGEKVMDPFTCTGTFLIAASKLNRHAFGCDISEDNLKIAESRGCNVIYQ
jgi:DNA modification methylase